MTVVNDQQLQGVLDNLQTLANNLSLEGRVLDAAMAAGGVQTIRAMRTMIAERDAAAAQREEAAHLQAQADEARREGEEPSGAAP